MKTIQEHFGLRRYTGRLGIEIEFELKTELDFRNAMIKGEGQEYWKITNDGSLRNGLEMLTKVPVCIRKGSRYVLGKAIKELDAYFKQLNLVESDRTSVHVHLNVQDYTKEELLTFLAVYICTEPLLLAYSGSHRTQNNFCLSIKHAEDWFKFFDKHRRVGYHADRYSALNLYSLKKFGSLEFRSMRGLNNSSEIEQWIRDLYWMSVKTKKNFSSVEQVISVFENDPSLLLDTVFRPEFVQTLKTVDHRWHETMINQTEYLLDLILVSKTFRNEDNNKQEIPW